MQHTLHVQDHWQQRNILRGYKWTSWRSQSILFHAHTLHIWNYTESWSNYSKLHRQEEERGRIHTIWSQVSRHHRPSKRICFAHHAEPGLLFDRPIQLLSRHVGESLFHRLVLIVLGQIGVHPFFHWASTIQTGSSSLQTAKVGEKISWGAWYIDTQSPIIAWEWLRFERTIGTNGNTAPTAKPRSTHVLPSYQDRNMMHKPVSRC